MVIMVFKRLPKRGCCKSDCINLYVLILTVDWVVFELYCVSIIIKMDYSLKFVEGLKSH